MLDVINVNLGLTKRDLDIIELVGTFGKSYVKVIHKCFYNHTSEQVAKNRVSKLVNKYKILRFKETELASPRNYVLLTEQGQRFFLDIFGYEPANAYLSPVTAKHNMMEQLIFYALRRAGKNVSRANVKEWSKKHHHTPDLFYTDDSGNFIYVEIELTRKSNSAYSEIFRKVIKDNVKNIIYITDTEQAKKTLLRVLPKYDKLRVECIERFFDVAINENKIRAERQE